MDMPNTTSAATNQPSIADMDNEILSMVTQLTAGNQPEQNSKAVDTGKSVEANTDSPVAPDSDVEPEDSEDQDADSSSTEDEEAPEEVSDKKSDSSEDELIDFLQFTEENPNAKFKFMRNGKEVVIDAKKAAAILGQGSAIHEEARELKVQKAEFDEYLAETRSKQEGLTLAMEFTIQPKLREAYDEIIKTQGYQQTFSEQLKYATDPAERARIEAGMAQNERYIQQQSQMVQQLKPAIEEFKKIRKEQVGEVIENSRKAFKDKELKNKYVFDELRTKLTKEWPEAKGQLVPGIDNVDLISADEHILSLIRDGLKYRDRPKAKSSGGSIAATGNRKSTQSGQPEQTAYNRLREQAKRGDKKAQDDLILATINAQLKR
jgi:hypothetical protein